MYPTPLSTQVPAGDHIQYSCLLWTYSGPILPGVPAAVPKRRAAAVSVTEYVNEAGDGFCFERRARTHRDVWGSERRTKVMIIQYPISSYSVYCTST